MRRLHLSRSCASFPDSPFSDKYFLMMSNQHGFDLPLLLFSGASTILSALSSLPMTWYRTDLTTCRAHFPLDCQANSAVTWYPRYTLFHVSILIVFHVSSPHPRLHVSTFCQFRSHIFKCIHSFQWRSLFDIYTITLRICG